jgi:hypothetical protein
VEIVAEVLSKRLEQLPLVWDCGKLATYGKIGFITEQYSKIILSFQKGSYGFDSKASGYRANFYS